MTAPPESAAAEAAELARLRTENEKLRKINKVLMDRVERATDWQGNAFSLFQASIVLEGRVEERTIQLEAALRQLESVNADLSRAKETAEKAQQRLRDAIETVPEGFALFDSDDRLVLWNSNYVGLLKVLGQNVRVGTPFAEVIHTAVANGAIRDAIGREEEWAAERIAYHHHPGRSYIYRLNDGRWVQVNERRTQEGGTVSLYTDITEIKEMEEKRRERELAEKSVLLQATLESLTQGVAVFDRSLRLVAWNQRYIDLHRFPDGLVHEGTHYSEVLRINAERGEYGPGDPLDYVAGRIAAALTNLPRAFERQLSDGRIVDVASNRMPDGGFVNTYSEITERKLADIRLRDSEHRLKIAARELQQANESLERRVDQRTAELSAANQALHLAKISAELANASKTKFLAAASHDLHQPLNAARLFVAALAEHDGMDRNNRDLVSSIDNALEAIDGLLRALFDISKLDAGVMTADFADFEVAPLLDQLRKEYLPQARDNGIDLRVMPCRAAIRSDPRLLARILRNFLSNALRYTEKGRILLGCKRSGNRLLIGVWDSGIGVPEEKLAEIFQEFQQVALPGRRREKGMGLGLAIVERISRLLDHPITVHSRLGVGSSFSISVPVAERATMEALPSQVATMAADRDALGGLSVLAIDDDPSGLEAITALLSAWKCRVTPIRSRADLQIWLAADQPAPQLVIADYHLGDGSNGVMLIGELRVRFGNGLPAFVVTSDRTPALRASLKELGLSMLPKPVQPARLRALISHLTRGARGLQ
ncbi:Sensory box histidine kinase/response regulator [Paramagnetospirillum magnetotacticum MS-1]|uniref:histidine kinase n=1 Tax=Paramagnetospirillum magnetotacticum MS-1 TaxID=272627 RepID=A0A0C2UDD0_PARME|nr:NahK/ErcS family hybrid sensor histidine kinase/response regulator [Paramagnetospirillum magnetotacticum]KIL99507.1 Sensory box histidine kinase/response regulator [Paramagnetospirillum magnetotacticum MS-1]